MDLRAARVYIAPGKSGKARHVPLNPEGAVLFRQLLAGKTGDALIFARTDGTAWGKNHHVRPLARACAVAKVRPAVAFHGLRHTYASHLAQAGVDLLTISKLLGHADTRITSKHYAHLADKTLAAAVTKLPSFETTDHRASLQSVAR
jgi:integrase